MRKTQKKKRKNIMRKLVSNKRLHLSVVALLFGGVGVYLMFGVNAASVPNPPLATCRGYDVAFIVDDSESMTSDSGGLAKARVTMHQIVNALQNTNSQFTLGLMLTEEHPVPAFSSDISAIRQKIDFGGGGGGRSYVRDLRFINQLDKRPNNQNLIILITDMFNKPPTASGADAVKRGGTRIFIFQYLLTKEIWGDPGSANVKADRIYLAGPSTTNSIRTSDFAVNYVSDTFARFATELGQLAQPCANPPGGTNPGTTPGGGTNPGTNPGPGDGPGDGGGPGDGSGPDGSGQGTNPGTGTGGGGGGSTSNKPDDKPNPLPSPTGQGDTNKQPDVEPSPFFDGKLFAIGSDVDSEDIRGVSIAGQKFGLGWVYLAILLAIVTGLLALYFFWWRRMSEKDKGRWKKRVRLGR